MIKVVDVYHHYGVRASLRDVNLHVIPGELLCVMGPNGMGKTTLLGVMAGVLPAIKGYVEVDGLRRRASVEDERAIREKVVYLPDSPWAPLNTPGLEFLLAVGRLYRVEEDRLFDHAERLLELFDLADKADSPIRSYSTGQRKKIGICSALITDAPIMILDEPFSGGLDSSALRALQRVLKHLAGRADVTIVMAVPVPELVEDLADRIAVLKAGRVVACDTADGLREQTGITGSLSDVLETFVHEDVNKIDRYLQGQQQ